jgi:hypothetical protein
VSTQGLIYLGIAAAVPLLLLLTAVLAGWFVYPPNRK